MFYKIKNWWPHRLLPNFLFSFFFRFYMVLVCGGCVSGCGAVWSVTVEFWLTVRRAKQSGRESEFANAVAT